MDRGDRTGGRRDVIAHLHHHAALPFWALAAAWFAMMAAMMAPTVWPWVKAYHRFAAPVEYPRSGDRPSPVAVAAPFAGGYLAVWLAYSVAAASAQVLLTGSSAPRSSLMASIALIGAGAYQFSGLKTACLSHCRNPLTFFLSRWRDRTAGGFAIGAQHGLYCLGCCWALMATMLAIGVTNVWWMLGLTAVTFVEQVFRRGDGLRKPLGLALIALGVTTAW